MLQVLTYNDVLYMELNQKDQVNNKLYNGGVDALAFITGKFYVAFVLIKL